MSCRCTGSHWVQASVRCLLSGALHSRLTLLRCSWKAVAERTIAAVKEQLDAHPGYKLVICGHSLGGAMASLAAVDLKYLHKSTCVNSFCCSRSQAHACFLRDVRVFTYGAPRVGDAAFAKYATDLLGVNNVHRGTHSFPQTSTMSADAVLVVHSFDGLASSTSLRG